MRNLACKRSLGPEWLRSIVTLLGLVALLADHALAQGLEYVKANYTKYKYGVPMRDGKRLFTAVYVPKEQSHTRS